MSFAKGAKATPTYFRARSGALGPTGEAMQDRPENSKPKSALQDAVARFAAREKELQDYRELLELQQREFDEYRKRTQEEQLKRESDFRHELEKRENMFAQREKSLLARQRDFEEHLARRQQESESIRERLQQVVAERENRLQAAMMELQREKDRYNEESRKKLEKTSKDYVVDALQTLENKESEFHSISKRWSISGFLSLAAAISFLIYVSFDTAENFPDRLTWELIVFSSFKGLVVAGLLAGLAKYSFLFSRSYMQEALKNADRRHAINFGKFYLESYGAAADWTQVKEAFEHWNTAGANAFTQAAESKTIELSALERAMGLVERARKSVIPEQGKGGA